MTLEYLQALHQYLCVACKSPTWDENVHELRQLRSQVAHLIAFWPETAQQRT
jgi:hypothetical protein